jgi:1-acyl-sn-glycerol-3-phosphate acyltransferase
MTFTGSEKSSRDRRNVTDEIMAAIAELSGQEYVASYAPSRNKDK